MTGKIDIKGTIEEIFQSVLASPKKQRRLYSKTFWGKFNIDYRSTQRVNAVLDELKRHSLFVQVMNDDQIEFGTEKKEDWLLITYIQPEIADIDYPLDATIPKPPDQWFHRMMSHSYESEREVEFLFSIPLFEQLGYDELDMAIGYGVTIFEGVTKRTKQADLVLFDGDVRKNENALIVVESKNSTKEISGDALGQARAYAMWLTTPYYVITNGKEVQVFLNRGGTIPDVLLLQFQENELEKIWQELFTKLNKQSVIGYKRKLLENLQDSIWFS